MDIIQNTVVQLDLTQEGLSTGWTLKDGKAVHEACNQGDIVLIPLVPVVGHSYFVTYNVDFITSGFVQAHIGAVKGRSVTASGFVSDTIVAASTDLISINASGNCGISNLTVKDLYAAPVSEKKTIVWSEDLNKWSSKRDYRPERGFSLFSDLYLAKDGQLWKHDKDLLPRSNFFGVQYLPSIKFVANINRGVIKTFSGITYEANQLLITTAGGVTTSLGHVSELISDDFMRDVLDDGVNRVVIYDEEGVFSAAFNRDAEDLNEGAVLKGTYAIIELIAVAPGSLRLRNVTVNSNVSATGTR